MIKPNNWCSWEGHQIICKRIGWLGNYNGMRGVSPHCNIVQIGQNAEKSPEDWRDLLSLKIWLKKTSASADVKKSQGNQSYQNENR